MASSVSTGPRAGASLRLPKALALLTISVFAGVFAFKYVFHYYLHYNEAAFAEGAANYWRMRGWLLLHMTSGMVAVLIGPFQFSRRLRQRNLELHRVLGRIYLIAVLRLYWGDPNGDWHNLWLGLRLQFVLNGAGMEHLRRDGFTPCGRIRFKCTRSGWSAPTS